LCAFLDRLANPDPSKIYFASSNLVPLSEIRKVSREIVGYLSFASVVKSRN